MRTIEKFNESVKDFENHFNNLPFEFEFRENQKEYIIDIAKSIYLDSGKTVKILDAPTGSGKSIIALGISMILNYCGLRGYILTSDLALQRQYGNDIKTFKTGFASLMGKDNYFCSENNMVISQSNCVGKSPKEIKNLRCYGSCEYFTTKTKAERTQTTIFNYAIWLLYMNTVLPNQENPVFTKRDFVLFDEGHKIDEIVSSMYSPIIPEINILYNSAFDFLNSELYMDIDNDENEIEIGYNHLKIAEKPEDIFETLGHINLLLSKICSKEFVKEVHSKLSEKYPTTNSRKIPANILKKYKKYDKLVKLYSPLEGFLEYVVSTNDMEFVKNTGDNGVITIQPLNTGDLCNRYLLENAKESLIMSATFGDIEKYKDITGIENAELYSLENTFDYRKSPIWIVKESDSMNYKNLNKGIKKNIQNVKRILNIHKTRKGIIHTGTYYISYKIYDNLKNIPEFKNRIFYYKDAKEKESVISDFKKSANGVLIGPSLVEGISLDDDLSRFQIIMKVPYLSLADKYVKRKMQTDSSWYQWKTALKILQGIGRSIRNKDDWALTYILDKDFHTKFYKYSKTYLNKNFLDRYASISLDTLEKLVNKKRGLNEKL